MQSIIQTGMIENLTPVTQNSINHDYMSYLLQHQFVTALQDSKTAPKRILFSVQVLLILISSLLVTVWPLLCWFKQSTLALIPWNDITALIKNGGHTMNTKYLSEVWSLAPHIDYTLSVPRHKPNDDLVVLLTRKVYIQINGHGI